MHILSDDTAEVRKASQKNAPPWAGQNGTVECSGYISIRFGKLKFYCLGQAHVMAKSPYSVPLQLATRRSEAAPASDHEGQL
jgi:hypothetical protein